MEGEVSQDSAGERAAPAGSGQATMDVMSEDDMDAELLIVAEVTNALEAADSGATTEEKELARKCGTSLEKRKDANKKMKEDNSLIFGVS